MRLLKLSVPGHKFVGDEGVFSCRFDLEGEELYSVKWYKDNKDSSGAGIQPMRNLNPFHHSAHQLDMPSSSIVHVAGTFPHLPCDVRTRHCISPWAAQ